MKAGDCRHERYGCTINLKVGRIEVGIGIPKDGLPSARSIRMSEWSVRRKKEGSQWRSGRLRCGGGGIFIVGHTT